MEDKHAHFFTALQQQLAKPLPGLVAQQKMASQVRMGNMAFKPNDRTRKSAVLILMYPYYGDIYLPLIVRPAYDGVHSGQIAFPGGGYELHDRNLVNTALREAQEEIGINARDVRVLGQLTQVFIPPSNYLVQPVVGMLPYKPDFFPDPLEVAGLIEVDVSLLSDKTIVGLKEMIVRGAKIQAPFYDVMGNTVWGATAAMISEFLTVLEELDWRSEEAGEGRI